MTTLAIQALAVSICNLIGLALKATPSIKNEYIPLFLIIAGVVLVPLLSMSLTSVTLIAGVEAAMTAVGINQAYKAITQDKQKPPT